MAPLTTIARSTIISVLKSTVSVRAHGIATAVVQFPAGVFYQGYNPSYQWVKPAPVVVGWSIPDDLQNTFIPPTSYTKPDIICHLNAQPAQAAVPLRAVEIQWNTWPVSHKGPVIDYLARCDGPCSKADKTKLKFFKIAQTGLIDAASDLWGGNLLANNNASWMVRIPLDIAPGDYVLRHEIIALHAAGGAGAQNYPQCFNLAVQSEGTAKPEGVLATTFYKADDPGIKFDLFSKQKSYVIPGPPLYSGALAATQLAKPPAIKTTASGVPGYTATAARRAVAAVRVNPVIRAAGAVEDTRDPDSVIDDNCGV